MLEGAVMVHFECGCAVIKSSILIRRTLKERLCTNYSAQSHNQELHEAELLAYRLSGHF